MKTILLLTLSAVFIFSSCKKGDTGPAGPQGPAGPTGASGSGFTHYLGQFYGGGVVAALWKDSTGEHGFIVSVRDLSTGTGWSNVTAEIGPSAENMLNGQANTQAILAQTGHTASAASLCDNYVHGGYSDWYLPANLEMEKVGQSAYEVSEALNNDNDTTTVAYAVGVTKYYWASTEQRAENGEQGGAWIWNFAENVGTYQLDKTYLFSVRAVRKF